MRIEDFQDYQDGEFKIRCFDTPKLEESSKRIEILGSINGQMTGLHIDVEKSKAHFENKMADATKYLVVQFFQAVNQ